MTPENIDSFAIILSLFVPLFVVVLYGGSTENDRKIQKSSMFAKQFLLHPFSKGLLS